jgi:hypothetical protein
VPSPNNPCVRRISVRAIHQPQSLPNQKPLLHNRQAPLWTNIHRISRRGQRPPAFRPFHGQFHPGIQPDPCPNLLLPRLFRQRICPSHSELPSPASHPAPHKRPFPIFRTHPALPPTYPPLPIPSMELPLLCALSVPTSVHSVLNPRNPHPACTINHAFPYSLYLRPIQPIN